jgi:uncharacterized protein YjiS (DUF1127 family)
MKREDDGQGQFLELTGRAMASLSSSISLPDGRSRSDWDYLPVELAVAFIRPRLDASLQRLELRDELPIAFRRPSLTGRGKHRPELTLGALRTSWQLYRETIAALSGRSDRGLADIAVHREDIHDIAMATSFGWLLANDLHDVSGPLARLVANLHAIRIAVLPSQDELDEEYLAESGDMNELEYRMRTLEHRRADARKVTALWGPQIR